MRSFYAKIPATWLAATLRDETSTFHERRIEKRAGTILCRDVLRRQYIIIPLILLSMLLIFRDEDIRQVKRDKPTEKQTKL